MLHKLVRDFAFISQNVKALNNSEPSINVKLGFALNEKHRSRLNKALLRAWNKEKKLILKEQTKILKKISFKIGK